MVQSKSASLKLPNSGLCLVSHMLPSPLGVIPSIEPEERLTEYSWVWPERKQTNKK